LLRGVNKGNTASIKLYYELTGRYNPNEEQNVNIRILIAKMLEVIQKHVRDPNTLNQLAVEFSQIAIEAGAPVANNTVISAHKELS
jgi:YesN/AraC family two-component response regulator